MSKQKYFCTLALISLAAILVACSKPYLTPFVKAGEGAPSEFVGIQQLLDRSPKQHLDVIFAHGMCTHNKDWAKKSIGELGIRLGARNIDIHSVAVPESKIEVWKASLDLPGSKQVNVSAIVWSPVVKNLKMQLCYDQSTRSPECKNLPQSEKPNDYPYERTAWNGAGKSGLLDDCLADALIYQGRARGDISKQLQRAILVAVTPETQALTEEVAIGNAAMRHDDLVLITSSLGSKMFFDAIIELLKGTMAQKAAAESTFKRITQVFMAANQIPILSLADQPLTSSGTEPAKLSMLVPAKPVIIEGQPVDIKARNPTEHVYSQDALGTLYEEYGKEMAVNRREGILKFNMSNEVIKPGALVIALSDPNDLLSYTLTDSTYKTKYPVIDVIVSNGYSYMGKAENPALAHLGYLDTENFLDVIVCGIPKNACK